MACPYRRTRRDFVLGTKCQRPYKDLQRQVIKLTHWLVERDLYRQVIEPTRQLEKKNLDDHNKSDHETLASLKNSF